MAFKKTESIAEHESIVESVAARKADTVAQSVGRFTDEQLSNITDFESAMLALSDAGVAVESIDDFGTGFTVFEKAQLEGVPMLAVEWRFNDGDHGVFVSVTAIDKDNRKVIFNDGSNESGVCAQLMEVTRKREEKGHSAPTKGLSLPRGLKRSAYVHPIHGAAETFYIG